jgi:hypothetical protein
MPKKRSKKQKEAARRRTQADQRRALIEDPSFREQHAQLVASRWNDPEVGQRITQDDGTIVYRLPPAHTPGGEALRDEFTRQQEAFAQRFGRPMSGDDPLFWDPDDDGDDPIPIGEEYLDTAIGEMITNTEDVRVRAYLMPWRELGYMITEENEHMFSAREVSDWSEAVSRFLDES